MFSCTARVSDETVHRMVTISASGWCTAYGKSNAPGLAGARPCRPLTHRLACRQTPRRDCKPLRAAAWLGLFTDRSADKAAIQLLEKQPVDLSDVSTVADLQAALDSQLTTPGIVCFSAAWCGPCRLLSKQLEALESEMREQGQPLTIVKIDIDTHRTLADEMGIRKLPVTMFLNPDVDRPAFMAKGIIKQIILQDILKNKIQFAGRQLRSFIQL